MGMLGGLGMLLALLLPVLLGLAQLFASQVPEPYMDEPFHVPQTQRYCAGRWREWDPKITTFPGLYFFGAAAGHLEYAVQKYLLNFPDPQLCSTTALRAVNLLFGVGCLPLFYLAARRADGSRSQQQLLLMTAACCSYPLHFFYQFLYYTDVPSLFFTLATFLSAQYQQYLLAGMLGAAAVFMRQTNAVWVAFTLACAVLDRCLPAGQAALLAVGNSSTGTGSGSGGSSSSKHGVNSSKTRSSRSSSGSLPELARDVQQLLAQAWLLKWQLLLDLWPLAAVVAAFAVFVVLNGGIVVGDKTHHAPVHHLVQPLYLLLYTTAWLGPVFWSPGALLAAGCQLAAGLRRHPATTAALAAAACSAAAAAVHGFTLVHPFMLADNRHYTFYLWRRLLNRTRWARYAAVPAYCYSGGALLQRLRHRHPLWVLLLAGATCAVLVPAHLVEFRYFTVPFYLTFLHMRTPCTRSLLAVTALFAVSNAATIYLFLFKPFAWPDGSIARFIW